MCPHVPNPAPGETLVLHMLGITPGPVFGTCAVVYRTLNATLTSSLSSSCQQMAKHLSLGFPADMKSVITNLPEDPELRSKSINLTSASDNQWT